MPQPPPPREREATSEEPEKWVYPGSAEYDASLRALQSGGENVGWKDTPRCLQQVQALFPKATLPVATRILASKAAAAMEAAGKLCRYLFEGQDDQFGTKFTVSKYVVFMHWTVVDASIIEPSIEVTSCHEDGK